MRDVVTSVLELVGAALIVAGVALVFVPAALIVAGVFLAGFAFVAGDR
jgi:hypothetical protein